MDASNLFITKETPIHGAIKVLDQTAKKLLLVVVEERLIGIVTDGDIRRWILKGGDLSLPVYHIMNTKPLYLKKEEANLAFELMKLNKIEGIPLVDEEHKVLDVLFWNEVSNQHFISDKKDDTPVIIMAGGKGSRLYPYTKIIPKPLIPIKDTPIIERIMKKFMHYGFYEFYLTIYYKKDMIKAYFAGDQAFPIHFVEEEKPLGTAGALKLLDIPKGRSFFVSNCDILIDINYANLLAYHKEHKNKITVVTALKSFEIPYGVIQLGKEGCIEHVEEKPKYELLVNTGFYVIDEEIRKYIPQNQCFDMTDLIQACRDYKEPIGAYPIMGSNWLDMGEFGEMNHMIKRLE